MNKVFTIGYEGMEITSWLNLLHEVGVEVLVDIREIPISRKKGFSKKSLQKHLEAFQIGYAHYKELGSPKEIRDQLHKDKNYPKFFLEFDDYLNTHEHALNEVLQIAKQKNIALMCFEQNHKQCHRQVVALRLKHLSPDTVKVVHLDGTKPMAKEKSSDCC